ncbi:PREDICTED: uncharacterized protein LOC109592524 [Amphimedon queenslandica]|uniref:Uncharacterized protein n=1 Tax=Amphimedon queenslandica TaxID=400682 RepID=A0AAN0K2F3_AMPQE|nr:PREDICTED: uncharacterized protein LOC109592524 [Amphimedon queenslandica]|eukprot:XP_019863513.1 PREDICTED: uncharacterized protein LOC109592524 [Amphimedon queenslandica]
MPVIKIRHSNNLTTTAATLNTSASNAVSITPLLYNFTMSNEITVQPGDILMIESNATNYMFYQQYNGPHNYRLGDNNELIALDTNDYPFISVVVEPFTNATTSTISSSTHINTVITVLPSSSIYSTATVTMESVEYTETSLTSSNSLSLTIGTTSVMGTPVSTLQSTDSNTLIIAGSISTAVFILLVVTILVILIVSVLVCRRIWYRTSNGNDIFSSDERKADIIQQSEAPNMDKIQNILLASTNPAYEVTGENCNTDVSANPAYGINTGGGIESINEEALVYDEPRTIMYNEQEVTIMQNEAYGQL